MNADAALNLLRAWTCKTQGRYHVRVPHAGTGQRSRFEAQLIDTDAGQSPVFWIVAESGQAQGWGHCPDETLEARLYESLRDEGFVARGPTEITARAIRKRKAQSPLRSSATAGTPPPDDDRWKRRVKLLERRQRFAKEALDGKHDALIIARAEGHSFEEYLATFGDPDLVPY